jgi:hypothetical protein
MAGSVNKLILIGNLGANPEIRHTQDGRPIANLRIATSESWRDKATGERKEKTEWHRVVIFNENLCKVAEQYLKKDRRFSSRGNCRRANGRTNRARTAIRPKWCCKAFAASSRCLIAPAAVARAAAISRPTMRAVRSARQRRCPRLRPRAPCADRALTWTTTFRFSRGGGPSVPNRMPCGDSAESAGAFWTHYATGPPSRQGLKTNPRAFLSHWMRSWIMMVATPTVTPKAAIPARIAQTSERGRR